ncbi:MAG: hypothetical protein ACRDK3_09775 [Actinomycetota bacterium]
MKAKGMFRFGIVAATVAVVLPITATAGGDISAPGTVTIDHKPRRDGFKGVVDAEKFDGYSEKGCRNLRQVVVKRKQQGRDKTVNRDLTNWKGRYFAPNLLRRKKFHSGRFYAKLVEKRLTAEGMSDVVCEKAVSKVIRVP